MRRRSKSDLIRAAAAARKPLVDSLESRVMLSVVPEGFGESLFAENVISPTSMAFAPDGRLFVAEKGGDLKVIKNGSLLPTPFLTVDTSTFSERGLGGVAIDPEFDDNGYVYVYYTTPEPNAHNRLSRFTAAPNGGDVALAGSEQVLLDLPSPGNGTAHNGGAMKFLPDGTLLVGVGDHSYSLQAQEMNSLFGKILRLNPDGSIPADNPFYNTATGVNRAIWALGVRNPFTMDVQPGTGRVFINDVGNAAWEEINDGAAGANFGWVTTEGPFDPLQHPNFTEPFYYYDHSVGQAVTGGAFYNPGAVQFPAENVGQYFFADFAAGFINRLNPVTKQVTPFATQASGAVDLDVGPDGSLYWLSRFTNCVYKIRATDAPSVSSHPQSQLISVGQPVTFSVTASGQLPIGYQWQRDGVDIEGAEGPTYTIDQVTLADSGAQFRCLIGNLHGSTVSDAATLTVTTDQPPTPTILTPVAGTKYRGGMNISFSGEASDTEDGTLPGSSMTWWVDFHHATHIHPFLAPQSGMTSGTFEIPTLDHGAANVWYRINLSVTDSAGFTRTTYRDLQPTLATITLQANHPGLQLALDGQPSSTPIVMTGVVGTQRILTAPQSQMVNGLSFDFASWSNGGAAQQLIFFPEDDTTYTATYSPYTDYWLTDRPWVSGAGLIPPVIDGNQWGETMRLNGQAHARGLGANTPAEFVYDIGGQGFQRFRASIGIDDVVGGLGTAVFEVWVDGVRKYQSGVLTGADAGVDIDVDVAGGSTLRLVATDGGDSPGSDNIDWGSTRLVKFLHAVPDAPTALAATSPIYNRVTLSWDDNSTDEGAFYIERSLDGVNFTQIASVAADVNTFIDPYRSPGTTYHYRVRAHNTVGNSAYTAVASATTAAATLPAPWNETDVGDIAPKYAGSVSYDAGVFAVTGGGLAIGTEADAMHGVYRSLTGDGVITARLVNYSAETVFDTAQAGIFIRESMDAGSRAANFIATEGTNSVFFKRTITGGDSAVQFGPPLSRPHWLRLERSGNLFTASVSTNGTDWIVFGIDTIPMGQQTVVGLAVSSNNAFGAVTATFDNVTVETLSPYIVNPPSATTTSSSAATLAVLGDDDGGESNLTYTWSTTGKPAAAADPVFPGVDNGTNAGKSLDVVFDQAGQYTFNVRISDGTRYSDSTITYTVAQALAGVSLAPATLTMPRNTTHQFVASGVDQFGDAMTAAALPELTWGVARAGTISADGLYAAPNANATAVVKVWAGAFYAQSDVTIVQPAPGIVTPATATPNPVTGTTAALSALGESLIGEASLVYTWSALAKPAGATVNFSANGTNAAKNATATFDQAGNYTLQVAIHDGTSTTLSQVELTVAQTPTAVTLTPDPVPQLEPGATQAFAAVVMDQFGDVITGAGIDWSVTGDTGGAGANAISAAGLLTAGTTLGNFVVTATVTGTAGPSAVSDSVTVTIDGVAPTATWMNSPAPAPEDSEWIFQVTYEDAAGIDVSSLGNNDIIVVAPGGEAYATELLSVDPPGNGTSRVATYRLTLDTGVFAVVAPGGMWTATLGGGSVQDVNGNAIADSLDLGGFVMDGGFASVDPAGTLVINGTFNTDEMAIGVVGGQITVTVNGQSLAFDASLVTDVLVRGYHGDDTVVLTDLGGTIRYVGGSGNDEIIVAAGSTELTQDLGDAGNGDALVSVTVLDGASLVISALQHLGALTLGGDAHVSVLGDPGTIIIDTNYLTIAPAATLDLGGQSLIVQSGQIGQGDGQGGAYNGLTALLASGFNGGAWDGAGITSAAAAALGDGVTGLGIGLAADVLGLPDGNATGSWRGQAVTGNSVIIAYTYLGDANLDGLISGDDYAAIDLHIAVPGASGYARGDFNFDGIISGDDYAAIDLNIVTQGEPMLG